MQPFLIDYDSTQSLTLFDGEREVACCNLVPPFPDFPTEWSATVEANIVNDGYTYVQRELYSASQVRFVTDSCRADPSYPEILCLTVAHSHLAAMASLACHFKSVYRSWKARIVLSLCSSCVAAVRRKRCGWTCTRTAPTP